MMKKLLCTFVALAAIGLIGTSTAQAGGISFSLVSRYGSHYGGQGYGGYHRSPYLSRSHSYYFPRHSYYHDTSHYDYHPPAFQRHYNHYHYVPGHSYFHRSGHWHH